MVERPVDVHDGNYGRIQRGETADGGTAALLTTSWQLREHLDQGGMRLQITEAELTRTTEQQGFRLFSQVHAWYVKIARQLQRSEPRVQRLDPSISETS